MEIIRSFVEKDDEPTGDKDGDHKSDKEPKKHTRKVEKGKGIIMKSRHSIIVDLEKCPIDIIS